MRTSPEDWHAPGQKPRHSSHPATLLALGLSSSFLLSLGLPNEVFRLGMPLLGLVALIPLYVALRGCRSYGMAALVTGLFGACQHAMSSYWLYFFQDFAFWTIGISTAAYAVVYSVLGLYLGLILRRSGAGRPLAFAAMWAGFEYLKSNGFLGYPWGLIPYSLTGVLPLLQIADVTGVYGISALLAFANASLAELLAGKPSPMISRSEGSLLHHRTLSRNPLTGRQMRGYLVAAALAILLTAGYGWARMGIRIPEIGSFRALLVQQNNDPWLVGEEAGLSANVELAERALAEGGAKPDIVVFSETSLRRPYAEFRQYFSTEPAGHPLIPFIAKTGVPLLTGAPVVTDWKTFTATNSVLLIGADPRLVASYAKIHPVPFAEAIPFWDLAWFRNFVQKVVGLDSGWALGKDYTLFRLETRGGSFSFGTPICFEDAFPEVCRPFFLSGADLLINLTNDSWSKTVSAEIQHWAAARFRSIEFRRTLVRSTNGGLSCVVGPYGELLAAMPLFEASSRIVEVPVYRTAAPTFYESHGDLFAALLVLLSATWSIILMGREHDRGSVRRRRTHEHNRIPLG
ncbi:MAG TPA: apolipoprotein N-acyltransferase [Rectinemataceae bacterium]|nr:apolipoprotein N-acyltransferase [Rectinemataceae bacterium]